MSAEKQVCRITVVVNKEVLNASGGTEMLLREGVVSLTAATGRSQRLRERTGMAAALLGSTALSDSPIEILSFVTDASRELETLNAFAAAFRLSVPGRGSIFSELVGLTDEQGLHAAASCTPKAGSVLRMESELMGICCIVQRGQGNPIARVALDTGTCVPAINYGIGTGIRDKLGLLRITIPAEKEIVNIVATTYDAESIMDLMIDAGRLDLPGRGFIYTYPLSRGFIDRKVVLGMPRHAASMDQIVSAIDELKGNAAWRSRGGTSKPAGRSSRKYLRDLVDLTILCDEGRGTDLVKAAMAVGAAGATISQFKSSAAPGSAAASMSPARESCSMIVGKPLIATIMKALEDAGLFNDKTHGQVVARPVPKACTYLGK